MGCAISKAHRITDSSTLHTNAPPVEVIKTAQNLIAYFTNEVVDDKPKCIFIFGKRDFCGFRCFPCFACVALLTRRTHTHTLALAHCVFLRTTNALVTLAFSRALVYLPSPVLASVATHHRTAPHHYTGV
jgi:hypothetical protein